MYKVLVFLLVAWASSGHGAPEHEERRGGTYEIDITDEMNASWAQQNMQKRRSGNTCSWIAPASYSCQGNELAFGGGWVCGTDSARAIGSNRLIVDEGRETVDVEISWDYSYILKVLPWLRIGNTTMSGSYRVVNPKFCLSFRVSYRGGCRVEMNHYRQCGHGNVLLWSSVREHDWSDMTSIYRDCILPTRNQEMKAAEERIREDLEDFYCPADYQPRDQELGDRFASGSFVLILVATVGDEEPLQAF